MLLKQSLRQKESIAKEWPVCHLLKYLFQKQQIQQMIAVEQEASIMIFYKLKHLLFEEDWEEEQIVSFLKEDPIKAIDSIILTLTQQYNHKVDEILEPLKEEKNYLLNKLEQATRQLQRSLQQNQEFKVIIDKHEDVSKEVELKIRQQQIQICRIKDVILLQINEKNQIKDQCLEILQKNRQISTENCRIMDYILNSDKEVISLKSLSENLKVRNQQLISQYKALTNKVKQMQAQILGQNQQNQLLRQKITEKEEFISSFVNEYNRIHIFGKRSEDSKSCKNEEDQGQDKDELKGFNFNQFEKESITSKQSLNTSNNKQSDQSMDSKFHQVDAAYQKLKCLMVLRNVDSSQKKYEMIQNLSLKNSKLHIKSVNNSILKSQKSQTHRSKAKITTVISKNYAEKQIIYTPSNNHYEENNCINSLLEKKLVANNQQIDKLQKQIQTLNHQYMEQREDMTEMEGGYELQIDQLKDQLSFIKNKFNETYQHYLLAKLELQACQQKMQQMQMEIEQMKQQHRLYCLQLKDRCKEYVKTKINEVQKNYQLMKQQIADFNFKKDQQHQNQKCHLQQIQANPHQLSNKRELNIQRNKVIVHQQQQINSGHEIFEKIHIPINELKNIELIDIHLKDKTNSKQMPELLKNQSVQFDCQQNGRIVQGQTKLFLQSKVYIESICCKNKKLSQIKHKSVFIVPKENNLTINNKIKEIYIPFSKQIKLSIYSNFGSIFVLPCQKKKSFFNNLSENSSVDMLNKQNAKINSQETNFGTLQSKIIKQRPNSAVISHFSLANESISSLSKTPSIHRQQPEIQFFAEPINPGPNLPQSQWLQQIYQTSEYILQRSNTYESLKQLNDESSISIQEKDTKYKNMQLFPTKRQGNIQQSQKGFPKLMIKIPYFCKDQIFSNSSYNPKCQQQNLQEGRILQIQKIICQSEEYKNSLLCNSLLTKSMVANDLLIKQHSAVSRNVQSRSNDRRIQQRDVDISPLLFENKKQNEEKQNKIFSNLDDFELQMKINLNEIEIMKLKIYLRRNNIKLKFQQFVIRKYFKKPMYVSRKLLIFITKLNEQRKIFLLNKSKLYCLQSDKQIKFEDSSYIDDNNFMFGQSQVIITGDGHLVVHRRGKKNKLDGNLEDGQWPIDAYLVCTYQSHIQH